MSSNISDSVTRPRFAPDIHIRIMSSLSHLLSGRVLQSTMAMVDLHLPSANPCLSMAETTSMLYVTSPGEGVS